VEAEHGDGGTGEEDQADVHDDAAVQFEHRHHNRDDQCGDQPDLDPQQGVTRDDQEGDPRRERDQQLDERHGGAFRQRWTQ